MDSDQYKNLKAKDVANMKKYFSILHETAIYLKENLIGKTTYILTQDTIIQLNFMESNFMHLCGISYKGGSNKFFRACLEQKLEINNIKIKNDGTSFQKLRVINQIEEIFSKPSQLTTSFVSLKLKFDSSIKTKKQIASITMVNTGGNYAPQSLLELKSIKDYPKGENVICIYTIDMTNKNKEIKFKDRNWNVIEEHNEHDIPKLDKKKRYIYI